MRISAGIIGGAGYTAGELLRLLLYHHEVELSFVTSSSQKGKKIHEVHTDLIGEGEFIFTEEYHFDIDVLFLCQGHGRSKDFIYQNSIPDTVKIIDMSHDFRLNAQKSCKGRNFVYGLPELNRNIIWDANSIANPGCFATSIELALLPMVSKINNDIHIHSITGSTGAGYYPSDTTHFSWRQNNISTYKVFNHQHLFEIYELLTNIYPGFSSDIHLVPVRGGFARGIYTTVYTKTNLSEEELLDLYNTYYRTHPFVYITDTDVSLKQVINTNKCIISVRKNKGFAFVVSIIDNLMKGASGQAIQNMNLMTGLDEVTGLKSKPVAF